MKDELINKIATSRLYMYIAEKPILTAYLWLVFKFFLTLFILIFEPFIAFWAINTIFHTDIQYSFIDWLALTILNFIYFSPHDVRHRKIRKHN